MRYPFDIIGDEDTATGACAIYSISEVLGGRPELIYLLCAGEAAVSRAAASAARELRKLG